MKKSQMTSFEKLNLITSICAILFSILTPIFTYIWLDPKLQELRNKAPLVVDQYAEKDGDSRKHKLEIQNPGKLPVSDIKVTINTTAYNVQNPPAPHPVISPASPYDIEMRDNVATLTLKRTLGPNERVVLYIPEIQGPNNSKYAILDTYVYSDIGSAIHRNHIPPVFSGGGDFRGRGAGGSY